MIPYEIFVSLRYLKAKRKQVFISIITLISILGVMLGVMALIVVLAVMNGFEHELREKILGTNAHILILKYGGGIPDYYDIVKKVEGISGVQAAAPFTYAQVMLSGRGGVAGAVLRGIDPLSEGKVSTLPQNIKEGNINSLKQDEKRRLPGIILGRELVRNLGVFLDDPVTVISPLGDTTPMGMTPRVMRFQVTGIFESGMFDYDSTLAYISLPSSQRFLRIGDVATAIEVKVTNIYKARVIAERIEKELGSSYNTKHWMEMNKNLFSALRMEKRVMFILLSLIIGVAAFNIICTLIMVVMEKNRDIAILKSMGSKRISIMKIFVFEGLIIGLVGTLLGSIFGLLIAWNMESISSFVERVFGFKILPGDVYYITQLPSRVDAMDVVIVVCVAMAITLLATIYPAWKASSLDPAEALRYE
jgi:lipoprotein-releasing system permease protein